MNMIVKLHKVYGLTESNMYVALCTHGYVHEFIPTDEIWVSTHHYRESQFVKCICKTARRNQRVPKKYFDSTVIHEITEFKEMKKGTTFWKAHQITLQEEEKRGLLKDPYDDICV